MKGKERHWASLLGRNSKPEVGGALSESSFRSPRISGLMGVHCALENPSNYRTCTTTVIGEPKLMH